MDRIVIHPPGHPLLLGAYIVLSLGLAFLASAIVLEATGGGLYAGLVSMLVLLSPALSFVNIVVKEVEGENALELGIEYMVIYGLPLPVPRLRYTRRRTLIAVNVGGAVIPVLVSLILLALLYPSSGLRLLEASTVSTIVTMIVTFLFSRTVPGVGIVVPAILPPMVSSIISVIYLGGGVEAGVAAFTGGALGSLLGADVLRLLKDLRRLNAPLVSIGGAGVFDGIYLSAILGFILAY